MALSFNGFQLSDPTKQQSQGDQPKDPKAAVYHDMIPGDTTDAAGDERQRQYAYTGQHGPLDDPFIFHRITVGADE